jgi:hypothetical protein
MTKPTSKKARRSNMRGQALLETVLLMSVVIATWVGVSKILRERGVFQEIFGNPWARLSSTIELGIPISSNAALRQLHPTGRDRHQTRKAASTPP